MGFVQADDQAEDLPQRQAGRAEPSAPGAAAERMQTGILTSKKGDRTRAVRGPVPFVFLVKSCSAVLMHTSGHGENSTLMSAKHASDKSGKNCSNVLRPQALLCAAKGRRYNAPRVPGTSTNPVWRDGRVLKNGCFSPHRWHPANCP